MSWNRNISRMMDYRNRWRDCSRIWSRIKIKRLKWLMIRRRMRLLFRNCSSRWNRGIENLIIRFNVIIRLKMIVIRVLEKIMSWKKMRLGWRSRYRSYKGILRINRRKIKISNKKWNRWRRIMKSWNNRINSKKVILMDYRMKRKNY